MQKIILASGSSNRKKVMDSLGLHYEIIPANIDEKAIRDDNYAVQAEKIARAKAEKVAVAHEGIIVAGDSFVVNKGKVFEKPRTRDEAKHMIAEQSGSVATLFVGFCYLDKKNRINLSLTTEVSFSIRTISQEEIANYVASFPVLEWSGGLFAGNPYTSSMFYNITGSLADFIYGFPVNILIEAFGKSGVLVKPRMHSL